MRPWSSAIVLIQAAAFQSAAQSIPGIDFQQAEKQFGQLCAGCHGEAAAGGDRAPALTNNRGLRSRTEAQIADLIKNGTNGGMPGFPLPENDLHSISGWVR